MELDTQLMTGNCPFRIWMFRLPSRQQADYIPTVRGNIVCPALRLNSVFILQTSVWVRLAVRSRGGGYVARHHVMQGGVTKNGRLFLQCNGQVPFCAVRASRIDLTCTFYFRTAQADRSQKGREGAEITWLTMILGKMLKEVVKWNNHLFLPISFQI